MPVGMPTGQFNSHAVLGCIHFPFLGQLMCLSSLFSLHVFFHLLVAIEYDRGVATYVSGN